MGWFCDLDSVTRSKDDRRRKLVEALVQSAFWLGMEQAVDGVHVGVLQI